MSPITFSVTRISESFITPCDPTPSETLNLSAIDRLAGLRHSVRSLHVFKDGKEPAKVIREAVAKALVYYYPLAGRLVDFGGVLHVACTGEGMVFVEAEANCSLEDVKYLDHPLLISHEDLLPLPDIDIPYMMQVTEFSCGGFIVGLVVAVHSSSDGLGAAQFINAISEFARGMTRPSIEPVWSRELIPNPPKPLTSKEPKIFPSYKLQCFTTDITTTQIANTKARFFEETGQHCSTFDISVAMVWQSRTRAIELPLGADVHVCFFANTRHLLSGLLPVGFYGNCFYPVTVTACSSQVVELELNDLVKIIRAAKARLPVEFSKWAAGEFKERDPFELTFSYNWLFVSDWTRLGYLETDYGWGRPVHSIPFAYFDFMAVAIIGAPPAPKKGARIMTQCVEMEHLLAFTEQMKSF